MKHKRNDPICNPWDFQGNKRNAVSNSIAFCLDFLIRNENITSEECKTKIPFEIILHVIASYRPSKLEGWSETERSFIREKCSDTNEQFGIESQRINRIV